MANRPPRGHPDSEWDGGAVSSSDPFIASTAKIGDAGRALLFMNDALGGGFGCPLLPEYDTDAFFPWSNVSLLIHRTT